MVDMDRQDKRKQDAWIVVCNPKLYDVVGAFKKLSCIEWKQSTNIKEGETVYIYIGAPYKEIRYRCRVKQGDLTEMTIDDSEFVLDGSTYENYSRHMQLELVREYDEKQYPYSKLREHGLKSVQGPSRVSEELEMYIEYVETERFKTLLQQENYQDNELVYEMNIASPEQVIGNFEYQGHPRPKKLPIMRNGLEVYERDKKIAMNALAHAQYLCEINASHPSFVRKGTCVNYTEPHHLVPMAYSSRFNVSLDVEENIISLCSNCHNQLHYGVEIGSILKRLYDERRDYLEQVGIHISYNQLLRMYNVK